MNHIEEKHEVHNNRSVWIWQKSQQWCIKDCSLVNYSSLQFRKPFEIISSTMFHIAGHEINVVGHDQYFWDLFLME